ncbi:hypothetical protein ABKN59_007849 [Abortiporus biennis]
MMTSSWPPSVPVHPWFRAPLLKRKKPSDSEEDEGGITRELSTDSSSSDGSSSSILLNTAPTTDSSELPLKRRRCDVLENGIAGLSLYNINNNVVNSTKQQYSVDEDVAIDDVEEGSSSWISAASSSSELPSMWSRSTEPEETEITTEDIDVEDISSPPSPSSTPQIQVSISPSLLDRLKASTKSSLPVPEYPFRSPEQRPADPNLALVLYKPVVSNPTVTVEEEDHRATKKQEHLESRTSQVVVEDMDDDAMDIEP